jgi:formylglycine-generating enzyme required for sulfatase activity
MTPNVAAVVIVLSLSTVACHRAERSEHGEFRDCDGCPAMITIPAGKFRMGFEGGEEGRPEGPVHEVDIKRSFAIGKFEVTQQQFAAFVRDAGYDMHGGCQVWGGTEWKHPPDADWTNPGYGRVPFDDEPVACVSWKDAQAYVDWLARRTGKKYRLPTEAEWEYVARAGTTTDYFWGNEATADDGPTGTKEVATSSQACQFANVYDTSGAKTSAFNWAPFNCDDGFGQAAPVGSFKPNAFGVHDIIGNVWEWTADCYQAPYPAAPAAPADGSAVQASSTCEKRVARGGSWITRPSRQRASFRGRDPEDALYSFFGMRVARDL